MVVAAALPTVISYCKSLMRVMASMPLAMGVVVPPLVSWATKSVLATGCMASLKVTRNLSWSSAVWPEASTGVARTTDVMVGTTWSSV